MKAILSLVGGILCLSYLGLIPAHAQYMENAFKNFKPFKFDMEVRGSYNISNCVADNMNCWEAVKPDLICRSYTLYGSVCDILLEYCHDLTGDQTNYWYSMQVQESWCNSWEAFTK